MGFVSKFNDQWVFLEGFEPARCGELQSGASVTLPHTALELPYNYFDETAYQQAYTYQKVLAWRSEFEGQEVSLRFDGAMADCVVYLNGREVVAHKDGYTPFEARLTGLLQDGDNLITVKIDGSEQADIPPFGGRIDYLTYAGVYRDVWLQVRAPVHIAGLKIETQDVLAEQKSVSVRVDLADPTGAGLAGDVQATLKDGRGAVVAQVSGSVAGASVVLRFEGLMGIALWDVNDPNLYEMQVELTTAHGADSLASHFGFRTARFTPTGFQLNGRPLKIQGLNRHQAFPYAGYALGRRAQERDAELLKHELKCNLVRTSHYPQSTWFLDHCDRIGLLVFEEIPGWQHIGGAAWQAESVENVRRMIRRDWNHPAIVLWGVRINESMDDHDFYAETNRVARELDATRQTGGVRYITESEFLEDVYTMNDFYLGSEEMPGATHGPTPLRDQREVTGRGDYVPYIVTEYGGHMFPTKRADQEQRQAEHVRRHLLVLNAAYGDPHVAGAIGWCMFDYNTHKDFGSGDRICHHGVTDMFRAPKFAAYAYASQCDPSEEVVLKPVTWWARGERNIGGVLPLIVLTNCDEVELRYGDSIVKRVGPDRDTYPHLPHAPVVFDHRHFSADELGNWGMQWLDASLVGFVDGKAVKEVKFAANPLPTTLEVRPDTCLLSAEAKDCTRVIVRAVDQLGNELPFLDDAVAFAVKGPAQVVGPASQTLKGGSVGLWLETTGGAGAIELTVTSSRFAPVAITLTAE